MKFYTGSYTALGGSGIGVGSWENGTLSMTGAYHDLDDTTYVILSADHRILYTAGGLPETTGGLPEMGEGAAASYRVCEDGLRLLSCQKTGGEGPCHQAESPDGRYLYVANYRSGSLSVFPVKDGVLGERIQVLKHTGHGPHPTRQEAAHVHQSVFRPGKNELFVCDLGLDRVMIYRQDPQTGLLSLQEELVMPEGMGPRHLTFADENQFYVTGELNNHVYRVKNENGWRIEGELSTLPEDWTGENTTAAIRLHDGALWVSNRGHDSLCRIRLNEQGEMLDASWLSTGGQIPRDFMFVPGGILFAHQESGDIRSSTGALLPMKGAVCICPDLTTA